MFFLYTYQKQIICSVIFLSSITLFHSYSFAQNNKIIDSLKSEIKKIDNLPTKNSNDTLKINILEQLVELIFEDEIWGKYNKEIILISKRLLNSEDEKIKLKAKKSYSLALNNDGFLEINKGNNIVAKQQFFKSIELLERLNEKNDLATTYNNLGYVYKTEGNFEKAMEFYFKSLKLAEENNYTQGMSTAYNNIGLIYNSQNKKKQAKEYFLKSVKLFEQFEDKYQLSSTLNNLAIIYSEEGYFYKSIELYAKSKVLQQQIGDRNGEAFTYLNMGTVYESLKKNEEAKKLYQQGLEIYKELNLSDGKSWAYLNFGKINFREKKYTDAKKYFDSSLFYAKQVNQPDLLEKIESSYYLLDSTLGNSTGALVHYKNYIFYRDYIINIENERKTIHQQLNYEFEKKEASLKENQRKSRLLSQEKSKKQQLIIWVIAGILIIGFIITSYIIYTLRITKKQKHIIEQQKIIVENKQEEILDSIRYAKRIQDAIITQHSYIARSIYRLKNCNNG